MSVPGPALRRVGRNRFVAIKEQQFLESFLSFGYPSESRKVDGDGGKTFQLLFNPPGSFSLFSVLFFLLVRSDKKIFTFLFAEIFPHNYSPELDLFAYAVGMQWPDFSLQHLSTVGQIGRVRCRV